MREPPQMETDTPLMPRPESTPELQPEPEPEPEPSTRTVVVLGKSATQPALRLVVDELTLDDVAKVRQEAVDFVMLSAMRSPPAVLNAYCGGCHAM
eukprot:COSAG01_NODE_161_length_23642_cov_713.337000_13_plen_96_part_00